MLSQIIIITRQPGSFLQTRQFPLNQVFFDSGHSQRYRQWLPILLSLFSCICLPLPPLPTRINSSTKARHTATLDYSSSPKPVPSDINIFLLFLAVRDVQHLRRCHGNWGQFQAYICKLLLSFCRITDEMITETSLYRYYRAVEVALRSTPKRPDFHADIGGANHIINENRVVVQSLAVFSRYLLSCRI